LSASATAGTVHSSTTRPGRPGETAAANLAGPVLDQRATPVARATSAVRRPARRRTAPFGGTNAIAPGPRAL
jgi:hypothetical protein